MEKNRLHLSCILVFLILLLINTANINAANLEGRLGLNLSSEGITVSPQVSALFENKFRYTARLDTLLGDVILDVMAIQPREIGYISLFEFIIDEEYTVFFQERCDHGVDKPLNRNEINEWTIGFKKRNLNRSN